MGKVIDLGEERFKRTGQGFAFELYEYAENHVGFIEAADGAPADMVVVNTFQNEGLAMTKDDAVKLRDALTECIESPHAPWNK